MRLARGLWTLVAITAVACTVGDIDFTGKACPCAHGWICDDATQTCALPGAPPQELPPVDAGGDVESFPDGMVDAPAGESRIQPSALTVTWTTGTSVAWSWSALGDPADFAAWEIVTGPTADDVASRSIKTRTFTAKELPELATFNRQDRRTPPRIPEFFAVTVDHARGADVFASVTAVDRFGHRATTNIVSGKTVVTTREFVIFAEAPMPGSSVPDTFARETDRPRSGVQDYASKIVCPGGQLSCLMRLRQNLRDGADKKAKALPADFTAAAFDQAYFQIALAGAVDVPPAYSSLVALFFCPGALAETCRYRAAGFFSFGEAAYRLVEVPLRYLQDDALVRLTFRDMTAVNLEVAAVEVFGVWKHNSKMRVDDISIRY